MKQIISRRKNNKKYIINLLHFHIICDIMLMFDSKMMKSRVDLLFSVYIGLFLRPLKKISQNK
jgi:hypothetical protein